MSKGLRAEFEPRMAVIATGGLVGSDTKYHRGRGEWPQGSAGKYLLCQLPSFLAVISKPVRSMARLCSTAFRRWACSTRWSRRTPTRARALSI